ncbi:MULTISPECIES: hypothetical protein [unclassified Paenibacillus]|uniref:hypothetical protein n=1 Tax=unclassified Paenibacillus TaxID=185978 RepID=UPI002404E2B9|nr:MULTISPECIES: hypothetical protein [unclassified Paenibacillus]MDF9841207.1 hypothetical protein [Paenibacillus sp. PastF-2]MDF9847621.1 hypothetical protein [Paenibacillus sp. PastM-2]MDF9854190.1 hypothetical protein [Paenibacillus sp. PastF-1]MDH6479639.1 hypothetical protein [Paenibacillus sp. PastH-2]MDH6505304.1 hypothetical protein [Paenibacillus sp. PastM-3]
MKKSLFLLIMFCLAGTLLAVKAVHADWANNFVVNEGKSYIITDKRIDAEDVDSMIGRVTKYSDVEGTYSGNFSNYYPKGTKYYSIKGVNINEAIAVEPDNGTFIRADYNGEYAGGASFNWSILWSAAALLLLAIPIFIVVKRKK